MAKGMRVEARRGRRRRHARCATRPATCWCSCRASARSAASSRCSASACPTTSTCTRWPARCRSPSRTRRCSPRPPGRRRVVLSTDIAESSLTVAGVRIVVDAGLARVPRFDLRTGMTRLTTVATSRASADQRAGRAGRTEPGVCYRLWSKLEHEHPAAPTSRPRSRRSISPVWRSSWRRGDAQPGDLAFLDPPPPKAMQAAHRAARMLGALDADGAITEHGRAVLELPLHPRLARMVVDARCRPTGRWPAWSPPSSTSATCCAAAPTSCPADSGAARATGLRRHARRPSRPARGRAAPRSGARHRPAGQRPSGARPTSTPTRAGSVLALAYPDRVAHAAQPGGQFQLRTGGGAWVGKDDPLADEPFVVAADLDGNRTNARIRLGAGLDAGELEAALDRRDRAARHPRVGQAAQRSGPAHRDPARAT